MGQKSEARMNAIRERLRARRTETARLTEAAVAAGAQKVVLFGSLVSGEPGLASDVDLLVVWDTLLDFVERGAALYRRLQPRVPVDLLVYTPHEMEAMADRPFVRHALAEGKVLYEA